MQGTTIEQLNTLSKDALIEIHRALFQSVGDTGRTPKAVYIERIGASDPAKVAEAIAALPSHVMPAQIANRLHRAANARTAATEPEKPAETIDADAEAARILALPFANVRSAIAQLVTKRGDAEARANTLSAQLAEKPAAAAPTVPATAAAVIAAPLTPRVQPKVVKTITVKEAFGIALKDAHGKALTVEMWDDPDAPAVDDDYLWDAEALRALVTSLNRNGGTWTWLAGPRGTGKTEAIEQLAARTGRACVRVNFNGATERTEILGGDVARGGDVVYREGVILQGIRRAGAIVLLDEVGFARAEYLSALHALLEPHGGYTINETGETIHRAEGVMFFAADNTTGHGDRSGAYVGVKKVNSAFLDRFARTVMFDYLEADKEAEIITRRTGIPADLSAHLCGFLAKARTASTVGEIAEPPSLRQAINWAHALQDGFDVRAAFVMCVVNKTEPDSHETLQQLFNASIDPAVVEAALSSKGARS